LEPGHKKAVTAWINLTITATSRSWVLYSAGKGRYINNISTLIKKLCRGKALKKAKQVFLSIVFKAGNVKMATNG
jgi:hypothetical protein